MQRLFTITMSLILGVMAQLVSAQTVTGVRNVYARVQTVGTSSVVVNALSGSVDSFAVGKQFIIIQMKGATINRTNTSSFGSITSLGNAGRYEYARVAELKTLSGGRFEIVPTMPFSNAYDVAGMIQLVSVPVYNRVTIGAAGLSALAWDSTLGYGGIIAIQARRRMRLEGSINANAVGFRGGRTSDNQDGGTNGTTFVTNRANGQGQKGEGIARTPDALSYGRGANANGGGGGNKHNAGGAGGGNFTAGGRGGNGWDGGTTAFGISGNSLSSLVGTPYNRMLFGGGGGGGQQNNNVASAGANGGGLVFLRTDTLETVTADRVISADGGTATNSGNDGAGGGGAGGMVLLEVNQYQLAANRRLIARASGGGGGAVVTNNAHGSGGGGGTGLIMHNKPTVPQHAVFNSNPGVSGPDCSTAACSTSRTSVTGLGGSNCGGACDQPAVTSAGNPEPLPVTLMWVKLETGLGDSKTLLWATAMERDNSHFTISYANEDSKFIEMDRVESKGNSNREQRYTYEVLGLPSTAKYLRLIQTDIDGTVTILSTFSINTPTGDAFNFKDSFKTYPTAIGNGDILHYQVKELSLQGEQCIINISSAEGRLVISKEFTLQMAGSLLDAQELQALGKGVYFVSVQLLHHSYTYQARFIKVN